MISADSIVLHISPLFVDQVDKKLGFQNLATGIFRIPTSDKQTRKLSTGSKPFGKEPCAEVQNLIVDDCKIRTTRPSWSRAKMMVCLLKRNARLRV